MILPFFFVFHVHIIKSYYIDIDVFMYLLISYDNLNK